MTKEQRIELIKEAKELGLKSVEIDGVKYDLGEPAPQPKEAIELTEDQAKAMFTDTKVLDEMSDDEVLFYSTPYYDQLQHEKRTKEEQLKLKKELTNG